MASAWLASTGAVCSIAWTLITVVIKKNKNFSLGFWFSGFPVSASKQSWLGLLSQTKFGSLQHSLLAEFKGAASGRRE